MQGVILTLGEGEGSLPSCGQFGSAWPANPAQLEACTSLPFTPLCSPLSPPLPVELQGGGVQEGAVHLIIMKTETLSCFELV